MRAFWDYLWNDWFRQVGEALLVALIVTTYLFTTVVVMGSSMNPTLENGERVVVPKFRTWAVRLGLDEWKRGEIAIIKPPPGAPYSVATFPVLGFKFRPFFIKRIVALPGDRVRVVRGLLYVNDYPVPEDHITRYLTPYPDSFPVVQVYRGQIVALEVAGRFLPLDDIPDYLKPMVKMLDPLPESIIRASFDRPVRFVSNIHLPEGYYFVMGDNRTLGGSEDSRIFGPLKGTQIAGPATFVWWPLVRKTEQGYRLNLRVLPIPEGFKKVPAPRD